MPELDFKKFTLARIDAFLHQIHLLREVDFPYRDSNNALNVIHDHISKQRLDVENSPLVGDQLKSRCSVSTHELFKFHRFLGYVAKSPDPINSFEIYFSFRRIAESILGKDIGLILNSDWDSYSPVNFNRPDELDDFVFIGMPVSEAENPLIVPLTGHELGHSIWINDNVDGVSLSQKYRQILEDKVRMLPKKREQKELSIIVNSSLSKCAEYFCDFVGLGLFGESYLYAFAYLLAPQISKELNYSHPNAANRAIALIETSKYFDYPVPDNFQDLFKTQLAPSGGEDLLRSTEEHSFNMTDLLKADVKSLLVKSGVMYKRSASFDDIKFDLLSMVPTGHAKSLADIVNAAWDICFQEKKWEILTAPKKMDLLNELVFKSFEILEVGQRLYR